MQETHDLVQFLSRSGGTDGCAELSGLRPEAGGLRMC